MLKQTTNDFSIVLLVNDDTRAKIEYIRKQLPPSPIRTDPPHMTILRGISTSEHIANADLLEDLRPLVEPFLSMVSNVYAKQLCTIDSPRYGSSAAINLGVPKALFEARSVMVRQLLSKSYSIESVEQTSYRPHISLVLGVALTDGETFPTIIPSGYAISFSSFALLRTRIRRSDGVRLVDIVANKGI